jgi:pimeloyl-ACP methyl ester carboxylesterase
LVGEEPSEAFCPHAREDYLEAMAEPDEPTIAWSWNGAEVVLGLTRMGAGPRALLLPALSSISTRRELAPLQERLAARFDTISADWPGFGDRPRPMVDWTPEIMGAFLAFALEKVCPEPAVIVAAGHGAGHVLRHAARSPGCAGRLVLLAPTWRGPLPTMMQARRPWFESVRRWVDLPVVGPVLYRLNVSRPVIRHMAAGHVYADEAWLNDERMRQKLAVTRAPGARHASVRFVTGALDPFASREEFLSAARACALPLLVLYGAKTPPRSKAEIEALKGVEGVELVELPSGKLSVHEEFPDAVAAAILGRC